MRAAWRTTPNRRREGGCAYAVNFCIAWLMASDIGWHKHVSATVA